MKALPILEASCQKTKQKGPPIGNKPQGGRTMRGSDTPLAIAAYHLRPVWAPLSYDDNFPGRVHPGSPLPGRQDPTRLFRIQRYAHIGGGVRDSGCNFVRVNGGALISDVIKLKMNKKANQDEGFAHT